MTHTIFKILDLANAPTPPCWFEFLLHPGRLQQHLETSGCDPSPTQLISLFFGNFPTSDDDNNGEYKAKKAYVLQTLAIKVASFLKWDLNIICSNLTIPVQYKLMQALANACCPRDCPKEVKKFAEITYSHWYLRSAITYQLSTLQPQTNNTTIIYLSQLQQQQQAADSLALCSMGELFAPASEDLRLCLHRLHKYVCELTQNKENNPSKKVKSSIHPFEKAKLSRPTIDCFDPRGEQFDDWEKLEQVDAKKFMEAACYDLGRFFFFEESYKLAKDVFEIVKDSSDGFSKLPEYLNSANAMLDSNREENGHSETGPADLKDACELANQSKGRRHWTEKYLFDCMAQFSKSQKKESEMDLEEGEIKDDDDFEEDSDLRFEEQEQQRLPSNSAWYLQVPPNVQQQQMLEAAKGDVFMSQGNFKQAMGCFVGTLLLMTDYFRVFSKNYMDEEPYISRMIQCSISLSCFTQAVALCQMTRSLNYTIAFKQLNERVCNDCCDDIYECIWDVTLLEYIINLHSKLGEVERCTKVVRLIGQLELNENNPEEILKEAEHVRRGRFFRIMSNKYL